MAAALKVTNNAASTVTVAINAVATSITIDAADAAEFPTLGAGEWFPLVLENGAAYEIVRVTARAAAVLTVIRAQEGTAGQAFGIGSKAELRLTKAALSTFVTGPLVSVNDNLPLLEGTGGNLLKDSGFGLSTIWGPTAATAASITIDATFRNKLLSVDASGAARTITLQAAATAGDGFRITIKKSDTSGNFVTIDGNAAELIDGAATKLLTLFGHALTLVCDGIGWRIAYEHAPTERGSNASGDYIKYADGRMVCTGVIGSINVNLARGNIWGSSASATWTFPSTFDAPPIVNGWIENAEGRWATGFGLATTTSASFVHRGWAQSATNMATSMTAIGRWYP